MRPPASHPHHPMRRSLLLLVVALTLLAGCEGVPSAGRVDPANTGFNPRETQLGLDRAAALAGFSTASIGSVDAAWTNPVVSGGTVFVSGHAQLLAFSADASRGCTGSPATCEPIWTADTAGLPLLGSPTVAAGTVFVTGYTNGIGRLFAFDAAGRQGCTPAPVTCAPLWTAATGYATSPSVLHDRVYVAGLRSIAVLDAKGVQGCTGTPKVCTPLWSTTPLGAPSFGGMSAPTVGDQLFAQDYNGTLYAYDAFGSTNCTGSPAVCAPLWTAPATNGTPFLGWVAPVLDRGRVFTYTSDSATNAVRLSAYDAGGLSGCSGSPVICTPQWSTATGGTAMNTQLAVAYDTVYVLSQGATAVTLSAYATDGAGCAGVPMTCPVKWRSATGYSLFGQYAFPVVANGVLYQATASGVGPFDAHGLTNCTSGPSLPPSCRPVGSVVVSATRSNVAVAGGRLYVLATNGTSPPFSATLRVYA